MNLAFWKSALRDNWYLLALIPLILGIGAYQFFHEGKSSSASPSPETQSVQETGVLEETPPPESRASEQDKTREAIAEYQQRLDDDPKSEDAPALLNAMGNLSVQKLLDYKEAARYYGLLIHDYPDWPGIAKVYPHLATCYSRLGDRKSEQWVYKEMIRKFPPESQENQYARSQLGLEPPPLPPAEESPPDPAVLKDAIQPAQVTPLVTEEDQAQATRSHDE
jgi:tetratricopeptide (TPR) repeat protein